MVRHNIQLTELLSRHIAPLSAILFVTAFICVCLLIPVVIWVSLHKRLVTPINERTSHLSNTPPFGGVAFYIVFIVLISVLQSVMNESIGYNIIAATSILFMIGLKDDLMHSTAKAKLIFQLPACIFTICSAKFRIDDTFTGCYFGNAPSVLFSVCLVILIINAFNLIDGIDGLAALIGIIVSTIYSIIFYAIQDTFFSLLSIITLGILIAFLRFNLSKKKLKIFMGDCGSMIIGLMISLCTLRFLAHPSSSLGGIDYNFGHKLLLICVILFIPFLDTSRIIIVRLLNGKNPFKADKNHVHHVLVNYGLSHIETSILLSAVQVLILIVFFTISKFVSLMTLSTFVSLAFALSIWLIERLDRKSNTRISGGI